MSKADAEAIAKAKALAARKKGFKTLSKNEIDNYIKAGVNLNPDKAYQLDLDKNKISQITGTGTNVTVNAPRPETAEEKAYGQAYGDEYKEIVKSGNLAIINDQKLEILSALNQSPDLETGKFGEFRTEVQKLAEVFGFDPELQDTTSAEIVTGISGGLVLDGLQKFTGAISDGEREYTKSITPGLSMSKEGNKYLIQIANRQNELAKEFSKFASNWISTNKGLSKADIETGMTWGEAKAQWHENNPLINPEMKEHLSALSKQVGSEFATNILEHKNGKKYIYVFGVDGKKGYYTELK